MVENCIKIIITQFSNNVEFVFPNYASEASQNSSVNIQVVFIKNSKSDSLHSRLKKPEFFTHCEGDFFPMVTG